MSSVHVEMAEGLLADFMGTPDGARAFQVYVAGIRDDRWDDFYRESIHQHHWREHFPLEQIAAFAHAHSDIMSGRVAQVQLTTFGATPARDADRAANAKALAELPRQARAFNFHFLIALLPVLIAFGALGWGVFELVNEDN